MLSTPLKFGAAYKPEFKPGKPGIKITPETRQRIFAELTQQAEAESKNAVAIDNEEQPLLFAVDDLSREDALSRGKIVWKPSKGILSFFNPFPYKNDGRNTDPVGQEASQLLIAQRNLIAGPSVASASLNMDGDRNHFIEQTAREACQGLLNKAHSEIAQNARRMEIVVHEDGSYTVTRH